MYNRRLLYVSLMAIVLSSLQPPFFTADTDRVFFVITGKEFTVLKWTSTFLVKHELASRTLTNWQNVIIPCSRSILRAILLLRLVQPNLSLAFCTLDTYH